MIRAGTTILALAGALVACKGRARDAEPVPAVTPASGAATATLGAPDAASPASIDAAPVAPGLPAEVGPPAPFDRLRPRMKQADALAALAEAGAQRVTTKLPESLSVPTNTPLYRTAIPGTVGYVRFHDGRLVSVTIAAYENEPLLGLVTARWGKGTEKTDYFTSRLYAESSLGWKAELELPMQPASMAIPGRPHARLELFATSRDAIAVTAQLFPQLAGLVGKSLDAADRAFPGLRRETADGDERHPERAAPRQGFAQLATPWGEDPWELVLYTDAQGAIRFILLTGVSTNDDELPRIALFDALRATFGELRPAVSEAGRVEIRATAGTTLLRVAEPSANSWWIALVRR